MSFFSLAERARPQYIQWMRNGAALSVRKRAIYSLMIPVCACLLIGMLLTACSDGSSNNQSKGGGNTSGGTGTSVADAALNQLSWCGTPSQTFRDQASANAEGGTSSNASSASSASSKLGPADGTPKAISDWNTFKADLGVTIYLPSTLPGGSCLLNVSGTVRDEVFGSNFTITYILPDKSAMSFSEAPTGSQSIPFQCNVSQPSASASPIANATGTVASTPTSGTTSTGQDPIQLCNGTRDKMNIVFSARGKTDALKQIFQNLQGDVDWMPAK